MIWCGMHSCTDTLVLIKLVELLFDTIYRPTFIWTDVFSDCTIGGTML